MIKFSVQKTLTILERTPNVLNAMLHEVSDEWAYNNEGEGTWSPFDVVGHLIVCEKTNFFHRFEILLSDSAIKTFAPIDMYAHFEFNKGKQINDVLNEFEACRNENIKKLLSLNVTENDLQETGIHPKIGEFSATQLLSTWATHDLSHIAQIARVMARQYKKEVGPFIQFLSILK